MAMPPLPTVLLRHTTRHGMHYDWMIRHPREASRLWTARVALPSDQWGAVGAWMLDELPLHRCDYLHYQGPVRSDRGCVLRIDQGLVIAHRWTAHRMILDVTLQRFAGRILLMRLTPTRWRACISSAVLDRLPCCAV